MKKNKPLLIIFSMLCSGVFIHVHAQESVNASGGNASGASGTASYSIGQVAYTSNTGSSGNASQGVQQAYTISPAGVQIEENGTSYSVYPNPASSKLILQVDGVQSNQQLYELFDLQGKALKKGAIASNQTEIELLDLPAATYFLRVVQNNTVKQTFQIIKTK